MAFRKYVEKLNNYYDRLDRKKADRIKPKHVRKVIDKLEAKRKELKAEIAVATKPEKKDRLTTKLKIAEQQIERANWLLGEIGAGRK